MFYTIYQITNLINGKIYIGKHQTKNLNDGYMGSGKHICRAISKYGIENFRKEILFQFDNKDEMNAKEAELVSVEFCLREDTYNLCPGGQGGWGYLNMTGQNRGEWHKQNLVSHMKRMSVLGTEKIKDLLADPDFSKKWVENAKLARLKQKELGIKPFKGRKHTEEAKRKIGEANSIKSAGKGNSQFGTMWITNGEENKKVILWNNPQ